MIPPFDLQGGIVLAAARDAAVTALLSTFGTIVFRTLVVEKAFGRMPPDCVERVKSMCLRLAQASLAATLLGTLLWLVTQAAYMADAESVGAAFAAVPTVLRKTIFGHVILLQLATLLILAAVLGWRDSTARLRAALGVATLAVALEAGHSHAFSMVEGPSLLLACDILHLIGAGAWLGGLLPLLLVVRMAPPQAGAITARWFSPLGQGCIALLVISAAIQGWVLVATIPGLIGTAYGRMVLIKTALFAMLLVFACLNRYRFAPALMSTASEAARRILVRSIMLQTGAAVTVLIAAVVLSELPPAMHVQALWPFSERPSLAAVTEDPDFRREVLWAGGALAVAVALLIAALIARRLRLVALAAVAVVAWFAVPHFDLLLVEAYPTSYYHSPTGFTSDTIVAGSTIFAENCVACHGTAGHGDGVLAKTLAVPPADLTAAHLWMHSDGELFWWISHGMFTPEGTQVMPGFADALDEDDRWAAIDFIRANNAGIAHRDTGDWPHTIQAPGFGARCGAAQFQLADWHGRFVRLVIGAVPPTPADHGVVTVVAGAVGPVPAGMCVARDETVPAGYAVVTGMAPAALKGAQFLIDGDGWLRAVQMPNAAMGWNDATMLRAEIAALRSQPVGAVASAAMPMNMKM
jgi:putative copper export protein/mono/diheme cytochrome c family protein